MINLLSVMATCVIVYSGGTNGDWVQKRNHEVAHCNGWVHPVKPDPTGPAYAPPAQYVHTYPGRLIEHHVNLPTAQRLCAGHYACQWFQ
jgi:hypothetical protein